MGGEETGPGKVRVMRQKDNFIDNIGVHLTRTMSSLLDYFSVVAQLSVRIAWVFGTRGIWKLLICFFG